MAKKLVEVTKEVQEAFSKDLDALCEKYSVKIMPTMFVVKEVDIDEEDPLAGLTPIDLKDLQ